mmetsp:Transcript_27894/g.53076  ORF Transcript_27894/g.53076 Transcript_27894/m.53076 type:complete len:297 (+) Transcript_27894:429-1319(+)
MSKNSDQLGSKSDSVSSPPPSAATSHAVQVPVPIGVMPGTPFELTYQGRTFRVVCPQGAKPGDRITVRLQTAKGTPPMRSQALSGSPGAHIPAAPPGAGAGRDRSRARLLDQSMEQFGADSAGVSRRSRARWPFHLFGCCSYNTPDTNKCMWFPTCCPVAVLLPSVTYAHNYTLLSRERPLCENSLYRRACGCGMGGCCRCLLSSLCITMCTWYHPLMAVLGLIQRRNIIQQYGIGGRMPGAPVSLCDCDVCEALCISCSLTQSNEFLRLQVMREDQEPVVRELSAPKPNYETMLR